MKVNVIIILCMLAGLTLAGGGAILMRSGQAGGIVLFVIGMGIFAIAGSLFFTPEGRVIRRSISDDRNQSPVI